MFYLNYKSNGTFEETCILAADLAINCRLSESGDHHAPLNPALNYVSHIQSIFQEFPHSRVYRGLLLYRVLKRVKSKRDSEGKSERKTF